MHRDNEPVPYEAEHSCREFQKGAKGLKRRAILARALLGCLVVKVVWYTRHELHVSRLVQSVPWQRQSQLRDTDKAQ